MSFPVESRQHSFVGNPVWKYTLSIANQRSSPEPQCSWFSLAPHHTGMIKWLISVPSPSGVTDTTQSKLLPQITSFILLLWPIHVDIAMPFSSHYRKRNRWGKNKKTKDEERPTFAWSRPWFLAVTRRMSHVHRGRFSTAVDWLLKMPIHSEKRSLCHNAN